MRRFTALSLLALFVCPALAVDVTTCARDVPGGTLQTIPRREVAVLQADLVGCHYAVALEENATLQLNDHVISGCGMLAVACLGRRCTIEGPGEITGGNCSVYEENSVRSRRMMVRNVTMHDTAGALGGVGTRLTLENVTVTRQSSNDAPDSQRIAVSAGVVLGTNVTVTDNVGLGIFAARRLRLVDSTVTGNHGYGEDYDFVSIHRPQLFNVTCGVGVDGVDKPWGFCANDANE